MKHSPLCTRDEGREIMFTAKDGEQKLRFVLTREMLDDICGATASAAQRKKWVSSNLTDILTARHAGLASAPFDRVTVEEIT